MLAGFLNILLNPENGYGVLVEGKALPLFSFLSSLRKGHLTRKLVTAPPVDSSIYMLSRQREAFLSSVRYWCHEGSKMKAGWYLAVPGGKRQLTTWKCVCPVGGSPFHSPPISSAVWCWQSRSGSNDCEGRAHSFCYFMVPEKRVTIFLV